MRGHWELPVIVSILILGTFGFMQAFASHGAGHTYPNPYLYIDFDDETIKSSGHEWKNLGTAGEVANAILKKFGTGNTTISAAGGTLNPTGLLGEAVITNSTLTHTTSTDGTSVYFGETVNSGQWQFLTEDNDDGTGSFGKRGANKTTVMFWSNGNVNGIGGTTAMNLLANERFAEFNSYTIWTSTSDSPSDRPRTWVNNADGANPAKIHADPSASLSLTNDGTWHMYVMRLDKDLESMDICVDGSSNCETFGIIVSWGSTLGGVPEETLILGPEDGDICADFSTCTSPDDWSVDEVAVWKEYELTDAEIDFLWNNGDGNRVLQAGGSIPIGGTLIPIDKTGLLLAGAQMTAAWLIPFIVAAIGIGIVLAKKF